MSIKILFLHGLESNNQSSKVACMEGHGYKVDAPEMNYLDNPFLYAQTLEAVLDSKPDLIVGSSMGGYFAFHLGTHFKTNLLLLNPALPNRTFEPTIFQDGKERSTIWALIGKNDSIVDAIKNAQILTENGATISYGNHSHRTPLDVFDSFFIEVIKKIVLKNKI
jgi:hypothetical protein